jgi:hypothetical protein
MALRLGANFSGLRWLKPCVSHISHFTLRSSRFFLHGLSPLVFQFAHFPPWERSLGFIHIDAFLKKRIIGGVSGAD